MYRTHHWQLFLFSRIQFFPSVSFSRSYTRSRFNIIFIHRRFVFSCLNFKWSGERKNKMKTKHQTKIPIAIPFIVINFETLQDPRIREFTTARENNSLRHLWELRSWWREINGLCWIWVRVCFMLMMKIFSVSRNGIHSNVILSPWSKIEISNL